MDEHMENFREDWTPEMDQAEAAIRDGSTLVACMFRELRAQGLSSKDAATVGIK